MADLEQEASSIVQEVKQFIVAEVDKAETDIKEFWNTEEPIVAGELKSAGAQLATIVTGSLVTVLKGVASGAVKSEEQFGTLVTTTYQAAIKQGLDITIQDAQAAATQVVEAAATKVAASA